MILCRCVDMQVGTFEHTVAMVDPFTDKRVGIDVCIATEIAELWHLGVRTLASCCGHGTFEPSVCVAPVHERRMRELGYSMDLERSAVPPAIWLLPAGGDRP